MNEHIEGSVEKRFGTGNENHQVYTERAQGETPGITDATTPTNSVLSAGPALSFLHPLCYDFSL